MELRESEGEFQCEDMLEKAEVGTRGGSWDLLSLSQSGGMNYLLEGLCDEICRVCRSPPHYGAT